MPSQLSHYQRADEAQPQPHSSRREGKSARMPSKVLVNWVREHASRDRFAAQSGKRVSCQPRASRAQRPAASSPFAAPRFQTPSSDKAAPVPLRDR